MARTNYFKLAEQIYRINPRISDHLTGNAIFTISPYDHDYYPTAKTLAAWKSRLRKLGVSIPDERRKKQ